MTHQRDRQYLPRYLDTIVEVDSLLIFFVQEGYWEFIGRIMSLKKRYLLTHINRNSTANSNSFNLAHFFCHLGRNCSFFRRLPPRSCCCRAAAPPGSQSSNLKHEPMNHYNYNTLCSFFSMALMLGS